MCSIYQNPAIVQAATAAFWTSCRVISKFLWILRILMVQNCTSCMTTTMPRTHLCSRRSMGSIIVKLHQQVHWLHLTVWSCGTQSAQASNPSWLNAPSMLLFVHACVIIVDNPIGCIPAILLNIGVSVWLNISINLKLNKFVCVIPFPLWKVWNGHLKYIVLHHRAHQILYATIVLKKHAPNKQLISHD
jgi:hypothetical protein